MLYQNLYYLRRICSEVLVPKVCKLNCVSDTTAANEHTSFIVAILLFTRALLDQKSWRTTDSALGDDETGKERFLQDRSFTKLAPGASQLRVGACGRTELVSGARLFARSPSTPSTACSTPGRSRASRATRPGGSRYQSATCRCRDPARRVQSTALYVNINTSYITLGRQFIRHAVLYDRTRAAVA